MLVHTLRAVKYDDKGRHWQADDQTSPTWTQVEESVRRLDKFRFPYVWLYLKPEPGNGDPDFVVMGGKGDYWMAGSVQGFFNRRYRNPQPSGEDEVSIWTSDQGFCSDDEFVCHDVEVVLRAVRHFYDAGGFEPTLLWE